MVSAQADAAGPFEYPRSDPGTADSAGLRAGRSQPVEDSDGLAEAVLAMRAGDEAGFAEVYRAVHPRLLRYVRVLVGDDAEDVASETWAHVCRDLHRFDGDADDLRAWIATIGRHRAIDHLRARRRRPQDPVPSERFVELPATTDTEALAVERITTASALALIASLPAEQAEAVMLRAVLGLDAVRAGRVLGKRPGAVRTAAHRGLKSLQQRLSDGGTS